MSLPESLGEVHKWQMARAKGVAEAAHEIGVFPSDALIWLAALLPIPLVFVYPPLSLSLFLLLFLTSTAIFVRSAKYIEKPRKRYFFAPFFGILIYSVYSLISLLHYLKLKRF